MTKIMETLTGGQAGAHARAPQRGGRMPATAGDVRGAVQDFLKQQPDVREVRVTKVVQIDAEDGTWEVEAEAYMPNATIRNLGLPTRREVLDRHEFLLRVDGNLSVVAYGPTDSVVGRDLGGRSGS